VTKNFGSAALLAVMSIGAVAALTFEESGQKRLTGSATGVVTQSDLAGEAGATAAMMTNVRYSFRAGGKELELTHTLQGDQRTTFVPGKVVSLCYDPDDPSYTELRDDPFSCAS
jgi:hypothetical protein